MYQNIFPAAALLVGGLGTRLSPVVSGIPKVMATVCGRPFLLHLLDQLDASGFKNVVLCTGHLGDQISNAFKNGYKGLRLSFSQEPTPLGTAGALRLASPLLRSDPILIMNGDSYLQANLRDFFAWHTEIKAQASLLLARVEEQSRYGHVELDDEGRVIRFREKTGAREPGWVNAGIYLLPQSVLRAIPSERPVSLESEILPALVGKGLYGHRAHGAFLDIGTPDSFSTAEHFFLQPRS